MLEYIEVLISPEFLLTCQLIFGAFYMYGVGRDDYKDKALQERRKYLYCSVFFGVMTIVMLFVHPFIF